MPKYLHVFNGDSSLNAFKTQDMEGECIVWREILCEGPTLQHIGCNDFWDMRSAFFESFFEVPPDTYRQKTIQEFNTLKNAIKYFNEVILWFEYDLFCQINMIGLLSWLWEHRPKNVAISLICVGEIPGHHKLMGLGEINPNLYPSLFQERIQLNQKDLLFAHSIWKVYNSNNHKELKTLANATPIAFNYLDDAIYAHFQRFPRVENGINEIEQFFLKTIQEKQPIAPRDLIKSALQRHNFYGFGDLQYEKYLNNLAPLLKWEEAVYLNKLGEKVLERKANFLMYANHIYRFGGVTNTNFRWVPQSEALVRVERL